MQLADDFSATANYSLKTKKPLVKTDGFFYPREKLFSTTYSRPSLSKLLRDPTSL